MTYYYYYKNNNKSLKSKNSKINKILFLFVLKVLSKTILKDLFMKIAIS